MRIPLIAQTTEQYSDEVSAAISDQHSHLYIDTSFLIWLTQLGHQARDEFFSWIDSLGEGRVHVPIWASHEFFRHHVQGLIHGELNSLSNEFSSLADKSYAYLRPFLDRGFAGDHRTPEQIKSDVRDTLSQLKELSEPVKSLQARTDDEHAAKVIEFINARCLKKGYLFSYMKDLEAVGQNRYSGRLPPGFQDRNKEDSQQEGGNKYGDLILWNEILDHVKAENVRWLPSRIRKIIILTNDRKNDWHIGGPNAHKPPVDLLQIRRNWKPVPRAHPMLEFEAKSRSRAEQVYIIDCPYLAVIFHKCSLLPVTSSFFVEAALRVELPTGTQYKAQKRKDLIASHDARVAREESPIAADDLVVTEPLGNFGPLNINTFGLRKALIDSRTPLAAIQANLDGILAATGEPYSLREVFKLQWIADLTLSDWVSLSRQLYLAGFQARPLAQDYVVDLIDALASLPEDVATAIYMGLLAGIYLENDNTPSLPPRNFALEQTLRLQRAQCAVVPVQIVADKLRNSSHCPAYVPNHTAPELDVEPTHRKIDLERLPFITTLRIGGAAVITESQSEESLLLANTFTGRASVAIGEIVDCACSLFGIPREQVCLDKEMNYEVQFGESTGFELPTHSFTTRE